MGKPVSPDEQRRRNDVLLKFISQHIVDFGFPPTYLDMEYGVGLCSTAVKTTLNELEQRGAISREKINHNTRIIKVTGTPLS